LSCKHTLRFHVNVEIYLVFFPVWPPGTPRSSLCKLFCLFCLFFVYLIVFFFVSLFFSKLTVLVSLSLSLLFSLLFSVSYFPHHFLISSSTFGLSLHPHSHSERGVQWWGALVGKTSWYTGFRRTIASLAVIFFDSLYCTPCTQSDSSPFA